MRHYINIKSTVNLCKCHIMLRFIYYFVMSVISTDTLCTSATVQYINCNVISTVTVYHCTSAKLHFFSKRIPLYAALY